MSILQQPFGSQIPVTDSHTGNGDAVLPLAYFLCYYTLTIWNCSNISICLDDKCVMKYFAVVQCIQ